MNPVLESSAEREFSPEDFVFGEDKEQNANGDAKTCERPGAGNSAHRFCVCSSFVCVPSSWRIFAAAAAGLAAAVIGLPTTMCVAPAAMASAGVATRA